MVRMWLVMVVALCSACATSPKEESVIAKNDAIDDYITVAELESVDAIRTRKQVHHKVITDSYILLTDGRNTYLASFDRRCRELQEIEVTPDVRRDAHTIRARFDTYRGCRISNLYSVTEGQVQELNQLGEKQDK